MNAPVARVGQLVRLLGSDKDGEVLAAAHALGRTLRASGHDWHDLADVAEKHLARPAVTARPDWQVLATECLRAGGYSLKQSQRDFLASMSHWPTPPSERQMAWLEAIAAALGVGRAAA